MSAESSTLLSTLAPLTVDVHQFLPASTLIEDLPAVGDIRFHQIMNTKLGIEAYLSIQCIIMNSLLLGFLFSNKEFRSWSFFPLMMQATVDILGPGVANVLFEWKLFNKWPKLGSAILRYYDHWLLQESNLRYGTPYIFNPHELQTINGIDGCIIMHLRSLLNEYSTGYCLLLTAVYRYLLVCHPTVKLSRKIKIRLSIGLIMIPIVSTIFSAVELIWGQTNYETTDFHLLDLRTIGGSTAAKKFQQQRKTNIWSKFLNKCYGLSTRKWYRLIVEALVFFVVPVLLIAFLYGSVILRLTQRGSKQAGRNRVLTLAFVLSWICWIACWTPNLVTLILGILTKPTSRISPNNLTFRNRSKFKTYWMGFTIPLQLFYSHLNPFVYLLVLKKFQQYHVMVFTKIWHFFFSKRVQMGGEESRKVPKRNSSVAILVGKCFVSVQFVCLTSLICLYLGVSLFGKTMLSSHFEPTLKKSTRHSAYLEKHWKHSVLNYFDPLIRDPSFDIRKVCGDHRGLTSLKYQRCFVLEDKSPQLLTFDEQVHHCKGYKANLCYPRSKEEMIFMWKLYENWFRKQHGFARDEYQEFLYDFPDEIYYYDEIQYILELRVVQYYKSWKYQFLSRNWLQMGFVKNENNVFVSVDGKFNISSETESWFYSWGRIDESSSYSNESDYEDYNQYYEYSHLDPFFVREFHGPGICLTVLPMTLFECRLTRKNSEFLCCNDFLK